MVSLFSIVALAETSGLFNADATPKQQFQQSGPDAPVSPPSPSQSPAPADDNAINNTTPNHATRHKTKSADAHSQNDQDLESQISRLNQLHLLFQQQTDQKIEALTSLNQDLQTRLEKVTPAVAMLNQEVTELQNQLKVLSAARSTKEASSAAASPLMKKVQAMDKNLSAEMKIFVLGLFFIFAMFIGYLMPRRTKVIYETREVPAQVVPSIEKPRVSAPAQVSETPAPPAINPAITAAAAAKRQPRIIINQDAPPPKPVPPVVAPPPKVEQPKSVPVMDDDTKSEYDFMGSDEAIPAKLDLARAYVAMEDYKAAQEVINQIMQKGNEKQKQEAAHILEGIPVAS